MARKVRETPVLKGSDAKRFSKAIKKNESGVNKVSVSDYGRAMRTFERLEKASQS